MIPPAICPMPLKCHVSDVLEQCLFVQERILTRNRKVSVKSFDVGFCPVLSVLG